jgi:hypothetical protein
LFGELQKAETTAAKRIVQTLVRRYGERLQGLIEEGKNRGEIDPQIDSDASAMLFIGTLQGLVMQSLLVGDVNHILKEAARVFAIYRRGIRRAP